MVAERFVFRRRVIIKLFAETKSENVGMSNEKYSINLYRRKFKDFSVLVICNE